MSCTLKLWVDIGNLFYLDGRLAFVKMSVMASQITSVSIVCSIVCLGADQRKHQSSTSLAFVRGGFPNKGPTSNGSWCMGIKGEMSGTVFVTFTWDMYIYELFIAFFFFLFFVHCFNVMGMFGNLMAIHYIMLHFIQNHSRFVMPMI